MTEPDLSPVKRALLEIRELRARVAELEGAAREPLAIVGIALRAPGGVVDVASLEKLLWGGVDAIGPIPPDRWNLADWYDPDPTMPGKMTTREGGFIEHVDRFDAGFFGIGPVEAASMDPQQRLALELAWEALENAAVAPDSLQGSRTGVYLGIANADYGRALFAQPELIDPYFSQGNAFSVASGRIAYVLGLQGPAVSVDTACSSSLVALHLACQALRRGECDRALVGGVNLILGPEVHVNFSKAGMMAADGRCKTFDAAADGYVRGEGGVFVLVRRLRDAQAGGDRILAVLRGSAINQDGRSNGLTAPNGPAQEAVLRAALADAGVAAAEVGFVETHGTGTALGDPIEVNALGAVMREGRDPARPLAIGAIKTNVGHLEAAAGLLGVAKAVVAIRRDEIPPHLHLKTPNPLIDWPALALTVPTLATAWPAGPAPRIAGVSSFGFSGTNAHVVLQEAPTLPSVPAHADPRPVSLLTLSAHDDAALAELVARHRCALHAAAAAMRLDDWCHSAAVGRAHLPLRLAVQAGSRDDLDAALDAWQRQAASPSVVQGRAAPRPPRVAFLFPGQGPQYIGMGRDLYQTSVVFREAFDRCADALDELLPQPLREIVFAPPGGASPLDETRYAQPAMFAIEVALATLWRSWGVEPVAVMGHSFGEYAAAHVAGALTLADAARMVAARGRLAQGLPHGGAMMVLEASEAAVMAAIAAHGGRVAIAAVNGEANVVISGERPAVETIAAGFAAQGARTKPLRVSHAFHSPLMDPVLGAFEREVSSAGFAEPRIPLVSNLTAQRAGLSLIGHAGYWRRHLREPVRFADAVRTLAEQEITHYIELSPQPVLLGMGAECVGSGQWLPSLREGQSAWSTLFEGLQNLYVAGAAIDWAGVDRGQGCRRIELPSYPFQRRRHWLEAAPRGAAAQPAASRWESVVAAMDGQAERGPLDLNAASYAHKWALLARITRAQAMQTLREAGLFAQPGERHDLGSVLSRAGIRDTYRHLVERWLRSLAGQGVLREQGGEFVAERALPEPGLEPLWAEAEREFADNRPLFDYVRHCGTLVSGVLSGRASPLETLFPDGGFELALGLYERSATMRYINQLAAAALERLGASTPPGHTLRVLEIGAGTGGTSSALLPVLPAARRRYRFTDVSDAFLAQARQRFESLPGVEFGLFNLDEDLAAQGMAPGSFDVVVSANAVHAVKDLRAALQRLHALLAPGGMLVLIESTVHFEYFDMTTGLIEGWQHFADDLRGDNPLLPPATWVKALREAGFQQARAWPPAGSVAESLGQHVIVAQSAGDHEAAVQGGEAGQAAPAATGAARPAPLDEWRRRFDAAMAAERLDLLRELVRQQVMSTLRLDAARVPALDDRLMDLGMDSLMAVQLRNGLAKAVGLTRALPATLMFDHPTVDAIARHLLERSAGATNAAPAAMPVAAPAAMSAADVAGLSDDDIARLLDERLGTP